MDRKAWIVLIFCGILLALNFHYAGKNADLERQKRLAEEEKKEIVDKVIGDPETAAPAAGLTVEREPVPEELGQKEDFTLTTETNRFLFSTLDGGVVQTEFLGEKAVKGEGQVIKNDLSNMRIGALTRISGESLERGYYRKSEGGASEQGITYLNETRNNLVVKKEWAKAAEGEGKGHRLRFTMTLANNTASEISTADMAIFTGSAGPVHLAERKDYLKFFWNENGKYSSEGTGYFKSLFGKDPTEFRRKFEEPLNFVGVENQFFATIVTPSEPYPGTFRAYQKQVPLTVARGGGEAKILFTFMSLRDEAIPAGGTRTYTFDVAMVPKNNQLVRSLDGQKQKVMAYGFFGWISHPLNLTLNFFSSLFGGDNNDWSWGFAIVALTIVIRTLIWPLHAKSTRTMKRMSKLQPKMAALKEKYPDDPNKLNQEMMKMYRTYGVSPVGGCLPMLAQIPIFFGFYNMLQYAVELRHQPFLGWVKDLSQPDTVGYFMGLPINILPILMAVTMVIQMKIVPQTGDKLQRRIFMFMPLIFFFFCYNFASALALYWTTQNIFSIGQTWLMAKMPEPELKTSKNADKKSFMQKLAEKAEVAQKQRAAAQAGGKPGAPQGKPKKPRGPRTGG